MRKLLINSSAIATIAALTSSVAFAGTNDKLSISATTEMKYKARSSLIAATDGTTTTSASEVVFKFSEKTAEGLSFGYVAELTTGGKGVGTMDESSLYIEGGFGKVVLGENDGVGENFGIAATDLIAEESLDKVASARISTNSDIVQGNADTVKIAYFLPTNVGGSGFKAGISQADAGATDGSDTTSGGFSYAMPDTGITFGGATTTTASSTAKDTTSNNLGVKFVSGDIKLTVSQGTFENADEDRKATGAAISYKLANGITLGAFMVDSDDTMDAGETYSASGVEAQYTIAAGLTAVVNVNNYDYKVGTNPDTDMSTVSDNGSSTSLTIKAAF